MDQDVTLYQFEISTLYGRCKNTGEINDFVTKDFKRFIKPFIKTFFLNFLIHGFGWIHIILKTYLGSESLNVLLINVDAEFNLAIRKLRQFYKDETVIM